MLAAAAALMLAAAPPAGPAAVPLSLGEGQVVALKFRSAVDQLALGDLGVVLVKASGREVEITGLRAGRTTLVVQFGSGDTVSYDVQVVGARRAAASSPIDPNAILLRPGEERRLPAPDASRLLLQEDGVARVRVEHGQLVISGLKAGSTSVVVIDGSGRQSSYTVQVR